MCEGTLVEWGFRYWRGTRPVFNGTGLYIYIYIYIRLADGFGPAHFERFYMYICASYGSRMVIYIYICPRLTGVSFSRDDEVPRAVS